MKSNLCFVILFLTWCPATAQVPPGQTVATFPWTSILNEAPTGTHFSFIYGGSNQANVVAGVEDASDPNNPLSAPIMIRYNFQAPLQLRLLSWNNAYGEVITTRHFAWVGEVRYEKLSAGSYLEMWSHFLSPAPGYPGPAYFSRTLADAGPMARLAGTGDWREFCLPFDATGTTTKLVRLEINLHLTGPGTVHLRNMKLIQYPDAPVAQKSPSPSGPNGEQIVTNFTLENAAQGVGPGGGEANILDIGSSQFPLWDFKDPKITSTHYAVTGEIRYQNVSNGYLEMWSRFAPEDPGGLPNDFYTRTESAQGPLQRLRGASAWRSFWLPFDSSKIKTRLTRIGFTLRLADRGEVYVRNVKLVQYPSEIFPASLAPSGTMPSPQLPSGEPAFQEQSPSRQAPGFEAKSEIDGKSFFLGVAATCSSLLAGAGIIVVSRQWQRRRHERELRRIASIDS